MVVYDPDPNPKNEEQAIARAHRIGQTKEVRVIHFEAVADAPDDSMYDAEAQVGTGPLPDWQPHCSYMQKQHALQQSFSYGTNSVWQA